MSSLPVQSISKSWMRRQRSNATKKRLYMAAKGEEQWKDVQSQLAMLTSSIDWLTHIVTFGAAIYPPGFASNLDPSAAEFKPGVAESTNIMSGGQDPAEVHAESTASPARCDSCRELLSCFCGQSSSCQKCSAFMKPLPPRPASQSSVQSTDEDSFPAVTWSSELMELLKQGCVSKVAFYDSCRTIVLFTGTDGSTKVFDNVPSSCRRAITGKVSELKIPSISYLGAKLKPEDRQILLVQPSSQPSSQPPGSTNVDGLPATTESTQLSASEEGAPQFHPSQLNDVVGVTIQGFVERFGESLGVDIDDFDEVAPFVMESLSEAAAAKDPEELYTGEQIRKLIELVTSCCNEVAKSKRIQAESDVQK